MIEIPIGKALIAVEFPQTVPHDCNLCCMDYDMCQYICCRTHERQDRKNVYYKLVDYPPKSLDVFADKLAREIIDALEDKPEEGT